MLWMSSIRTLCLNAGFQRFPPVFFSKSFIILHFTVKSVIHFALIFVQGVSLGWDSFFFFSEYVRFLQHHLLKRLSFPTNFLLDRSSYICVGLFLSSLICLIFVSVPPPGPHCFDYCIYIVSLNLG